MKRAYGVLNGFTVLEKRSTEFETVLQSLKRVYSVWKWVYFMCMKTGLKFKLFENIFTVFWKRVDTVFEIRFTVFENGFTVFQMSLHSLNRDLQCF